MIVEDYSEPEEFVDGTVLPGTGQVWDICTVGEHGEAEQPGAPGVCTCPLTWGSMDDDDYGAVTGWVVVSDLDGAQGTGVQGRLLAAYWGDKIWLKLDPSNDATGDDDTEADNPTGSGYVGEVGEFGELVETQCRAVRPQVLICPMTERDSYLNTPSGEWRGDLYWEVLANFCYSENGHVYDQDASGVWGEAQCWRVTIWVVPMDDMLCFYTTRSPYLTEDLRTYSPFANRLVHSAWGLPYEAAGYDLSRLNDNGGPWYGYYCALLPWEEEETETENLGAGDCVSAIGACGVAGHVGDADEAPDAVFPAALHPSVHVCARDHYTGPWGLAYYNACYGVYWGQAARPTATDLYGVDTWAEAVRQSLTGTSGVLVDRQPTQQFRFDAASIEGGGRLMGYSAGAVMPGEAVWPPNGPAYRMLTQEALQTPNGNLYLGIAGTATDGVLLTASMYAEPVTWADPEVGNVSGGSEPEGGVTSPSGGGAGGAGGSGGSGDDDTIGGAGDGDPIGWPPALATLDSGYFFEAGDGVKITYERTTTRDADGLVETIGYDFSVSINVAIYTASTNYAVGINLSTSNGGSYTVFGSSQTMYYGLDGATVIWRSSYIGGDDLSKTSTVTTTVTGQIRVTATPGTGTANSESIPESNILTITKTGRRRRTCVGGVTRWFDIYSISLNTNQLRGISLNVGYRAVSSASISVNPSSVTGSNSGPPSAPTVRAASGSVSATHSNPYSGYPTSVTGFLPVSITGQHSSVDSGSVTISGSASWQYDDGTDEDGNPTQSYANGSISGTITVKLQSKSF